MKNFLRISFLLLLVFLITACGVEIESQHPDQIAQVPYGEPDFPNLGDFWVIDTDNNVSDETLKEVDQILENLKTQGFAEQAIVVMPGVKNGSNYAVQLLRHLKLGNPEGPRKNNGLLWLVITDGNSGARVYYAAGNGLPELTTFELGAVIDQANVLADEANWNGAVLAIANGSETMLEQTYPGLVPTQQPTSEAPGGTESPSSDDQTTVWLVVGAIALIIVIGIVLTIIDPELGALWFRFWLQILAAALTKGGGSGRSGSGSGRSSRGGR
jgi:uncharacterized membrane protein YgcG